MTADQLAAIHAECFRTPRPWTAAEFQAFLATPHCFLFAAPEGFVLGRAVVDEAELLTIAVRPSARRRGTGQKLLADFFGEAKRRGAARAFLEVAADNAAAIALYRAAGFTETGRRPGYYRCASGEIDALVLSRKLD